MIDEPTTTIDVESDDSTLSMEATGLFPPLSSLPSPLPPPLSPSVAEGKDPSTGRFLAHNRYGKGNPVARRAAVLRRALYSEVSEEDMRGIIRTLVDQAKAGDTAASKLLVTQLLGPGTSIDLITTISRLEGIVFRSKGMR